MKIIRCLLQTAIIAASLSPAAASQQLRGSNVARNKWEVSYDASRTCATGAVVVTISINPRQEEVVFRVFEPGHSYSQTGYVTTSGRARLEVPVTNAFTIGGRSTSTSFTCTVQVGIGPPQKVACPTLPTCTVDDVKKLAPTPSPTILEGLEFLAPTESPTPNESDLIAPTPSPTILEGPEFLAPTESPTPNDSNLMAPIPSPTILEGPEFLAPTESPTAIEGPGFLSPPTSSPTIDESSLLAPTSSPTIDESDLLAPTSSPTQF